MPKHNITKSPQGTDGWTPHTKLKFKPKMKLVANAGRLESRIVAPKFYKMNLWIHL